MKAKGKKSSESSTEATLTTPEQKQRIVRRPWDRERLQVNCAGETNVDVSAYASTDVNNIVKVFHRTGELPPAGKQGIFADVTLLQGDLTDRIEWAKQVHEDFTRETEERKQREKDDQENLRRRIAADKILAAQSARDKETQGAPESQAPAMDAGRDVSSEHT